MRLTWIAAAAAAATGMAVPAIAGGEWPDGPNKLWFEGLQRPDNRLNPSRKVDQKSLFWGGGLRPSSRSSRATNVTPKIAGMLG